MRYRFLYVGTMLCIMAIMLPSAVMGQFAIGVKGGTAGVGGDLTYSMTKKFNVRVSGTAFSYTYSGVYADDEPSIAYNMEGSITSVGAIVDFYPANRGLKLSAGVYYHDFLASGDATPNESYTIDEKTFSPEKLGSLNGDITYDSKIVPYAGIGIGNPVARGSRIKLNFEIGALYTNSPSVTMEGDGLIGPTANQGQDFEDGLKDFQWYPLVNFGLSFRLQK